MVTKHLLSKCFLTIHMRFRVCLIQLLLLAGPIPVSEKEWLHYYLWWETLFPLLVLNVTWRLITWISTWKSKVPTRSVPTIQITQDILWTFILCPFYVNMKYISIVCAISDIYQWLIWTLGYLDDRKSNLSEPYSYNYIVGFYI